MRRGTKTGGYTIVEVMIFMAISGLMFIMAANFISGKQARSEFKQGMDDINSQVQAVINDVSNGFYPSNGKFDCRAAEAGQPEMNVVDAGQGSNKGCSFMGKVVQFDVPGTDGHGYNIYSVVGRQFKSDLSGNSTRALIPPTTFAEAFPRPVTATTTGSVDLTQVNTLKWGLQVEGIFDGDRSHPIDAVGFFSGFATATDDNLASGSAAPIAVAMPTTPTDDVPGQIENLKTTDPAILTTNPRIIVCFKGGVNQFGRLNIGSESTDPNVSSQKLSTQVQISSGERTGACKITP